MPSLLDDELLWFTRIKLLGDLSIHSIRGRTRYIGIYGRDPHTVSSGHDAGCVPPALQRYILLPVGEMENLR